MTTTLRPTGPQAQDPAGGQSCGYDIRVNNRTVGTIRLSTAVGGAAAGRIDRLFVEPRERRRGRAAVAVLAAEEVLRGWGCALAETTIYADADADADAALRFGSALGYTVRNRVMVKKLSGDHPPAPPEGTHIRAMSSCDYPDWLAAQRAGFIRSCTDRGISPDEAAARADAVYRDHLPDGVESKDAALRVLICEGREVGTLWVGLGDALPLGTDAYVFDIRVAEGQRGGGHGRTLLREAERICHGAGKHRLGLNVFAGNVPAERLYASMAYRTVRTQLVKHLG